MVSILVKLQVVTVKMLVSGPAYTHSFEEAQKLGVTQKTLKSGTFAEGYKLQWKAGVGTVLPAALRVPEWCFLNDSGSLEYVTSADAYHKDLVVWERAGFDINEEIPATYVHMYWNYMLQQPCFLKARGLGPTLPLLDIQQWADKPHPVTPIFYDCNKWKMYDYPTSELFWQVSALYGLLLLNATGIAHLDLSPNNVFKVEQRTCCVQYKQKRIYLPWTPIVTDYDDYSLAWRSSQERLLNERKGVTALLCRHWANVHVYAKRCVSPGFRVVLCICMTACFRTSAVMRAWMQMVLDRYVSTQSIEETIVFVMDFLKPKLEQHEAALRTTTYPESTLHHFDTQVFLDTFLDEHRRSLAHMMNKFSLQWDTYRVNVSNPYAVRTHDDWLQHSRSVGVRVIINKGQKRPLDALLA